MGRAACTLYGQRGFTLIELTLVAAILGIVAVAALPNLASGAPSRLDLAALEVAEAMRYARSESIRLGVPRGFNHNSTGRRTRVMRPDMSATPATLIYDVYHPISKKLYDIDLNTQPFVAVDAVSHAPAYRGACNTNSRIYFDASGTPRCLDPRTILLDNFAVTLSKGSLSRVVTLHGITGRVTIQ